MKNSIWILLLFAVSVVVRIPTLNRPLSNHHEFVTAHVLRIMQIWDEDGLMKNNFNPIMNYPGAVNKFINNQTLGEFDKDGNDFYESYPPFAYLFPYLIFQLLKIPVSPLALEIFNLLLHLTECLLIYQIVCLLFGWKESKLFLPAVIAVTLHLFNPCTLWFHSNVYMTDMLAVTLWLAATFLFLKMDKEGKSGSAFWLILLFVLNFLLSYTEYLGVTFTAVTVIYCLTKIKTNRNYLAVITILCLSCLLALALTAYQYSLINGFTAFFEIASQRYLDRSGYANRELSNIPAAVIMLTMNYVTGYLPELLLLIILALLIWRERVSFKTSSLKKIIVFLFLPVLLHHLLFMKASALDFFVLKSSPFLAILIAWAFYRMENRIPDKKKIISVTVTSVVGIALFYYINRPGQISQSGNRYDTFKIAGEFIAANSASDEVVFIQNIEDAPQLIFYAHRNLKTIAGEQEAMNFLRTHHHNKGVIFIPDSTQAIQLFKRIELHK